VLVFSSKPDVNWVGGITEARRIVATAAAYDLPVIPHGSSVFSYHLQVRIHSSLFFTSHQKEFCCSFFDISNNATFLKW
jgi:L-alanine-DL-glutamate epimerase-like enolase superfamily enzyme